MKKYVILAAVVLILGFLVNYSLGGFEDIKPQLIEVNNYTVYGSGFEGSYKSNQLSELVEKMRTHQQNLESTSDLVIINYINDAKETIGKIDYFVGIRLSNSSDEANMTEFEQRIIEAKKAIRIEIKVKPLVMPSPEKINETAFTFAEQSGVKLQNLSVEQYTQNGVLIIEYPVQVSVPSQ